MIDALTQQRNDGLRDVVTTIYRLEKQPEESEDDRRI
jgi:hypothetical protein